MKLPSGERKSFERSVQYIRGEQQAESRHAVFERLKQHYWPELVRHFLEGSSRISIQEAGYAALLYPTRRAELGFTEALQQTLQEQVDEEEKGDFKLHLFVQLMTAFPDARASLPLSVEDKESLLAEIDSLHQHKMWTELVEHLAQYRILFFQDPEAARFTHIQEDMLKDQNFPPRPVSSVFLANLFIVYPQLRNQFPLEKQWPKWVENLDVHQKNGSWERLLWLLRDLAIIDADEIHIDEQGVQLISHSVQQTAPPLPTRSIV